MLLSSVPVLEMLLYMKCRFRWIGNVHSEGTASFRAQSSIVFSPQAFPRRACIVTFSYTLEPLKPRAPPLLAHTVLKENWVGS